MPPGRKVDLLQRWAAVLEGSAPAETLTDHLVDLDSSDPEIEVAQKAGLVMQMLAALPPAAQEIILRHVHASTLGMARWQQHGPFVEDEAALDDYLHEVAGLSLIHISEPTRPYYTSYAVFCLKKQKKTHNRKMPQQNTRTDRKRARTMNAT